MGVTAVGKSTVMAGLADLLRWPTVEGDELHPPENIARMRSGKPLRDEDRRPWLQAIAEMIGNQERRGQSSIVTCSALKRSYRDALRRDHLSVWFAHLTADADLLARQISGRAGHFMPPDLLQSQLETLEPLDPDEPGAVFDAAAAPAAIAERIIEALAADGRIPRP